MPDQMRMFARDNKHTKSEKILGFWDFVIKYPPKGYVGKHRKENLDFFEGGVHMDCRMCREKIGIPPESLTPSH